ncbi:MAG: alanine dehydrogenase, partial [Bacteroidota bacterium]
MIIGLSRERKSPPDNRVALSPVQCVALQQRYPKVKVLVESSPTRCFSDKAYREVGIEVVDDLGRCDVIFNIKEMPSEALIPGKTYCFFSHTIKKQPYNRKMLHSILKKQITLIDYEVLRYETGARVLGFGRYAGVVGTYNGLLVYGKKHGLYSLKPAHQSKNYADILTQLLRVELPNMRIAVTGGGRVSQGALDLLRALQIREVTPNQYLHVEYGEPVFVQLNSPD